MTMTMMKILAFCRRLLPVASGRSLCNDVALDSRQVENLGIPDRGGATANDNLVGGNLQVDENEGGLDVNRNRADGNRQCQQNQPAPVGAGNVADSKEDQCRAL